MLTLTNHIKLDLKAIRSPNLCDRFTDADLQAIGNWCHTGYEADRWSRRRWYNRTEAAMDLALQIQKDKSFPWPGCANVAFPLVTIAALQFHARAYPAIINGTDVVRMRVVGPDPTGQERLRADRISTHMSWQLLEQDEDWEEQQDRALINVPVVGTAWKKSYYNAAKRCNESDLVLAKDLVLDYWAKSVEDCPRKTHVIPLFKNDIYERVKRGSFRDVLGDAWYMQEQQPKTNREQQNKDDRAGQNPPPTDSTTPFIGLEQHCSLDLDGDGYAEPYIITFEETTHTVLRIVTRFDRIEDIEYNDKNEIVCIYPMEYFTKIPFIPNPDGGIMDIGFGVLLGPLNEATNSIVNQLIDAGTMATTAGGFLGRGAKIRGGVYTFSPFGWNRVDSTGDDLHKSIYPLPVREPSAVLFQLLSLLINYTNRISGATDTLVGENPGQNTPAETTRTMVEQGQKIYSAIFKRVWRSLKQEFKKLYVLNSIYLPAKQAFGTDGDFAMREDYLGSNHVVPVADPNITSDAAKFAQARMIREASMQVAGYDRAVVEKHFLKSLQVDGVDQFYVGVEKTGPMPNPKVQVEQMKIEQKRAELEWDKKIFMAEMQETIRMNDATILELSAKAAKELEEAGGVKEGHKIAMFDAAIGAMKNHNEHIRGQIASMIKGIENEQDYNVAKARNQGTTGVPGVANPPGNAAAPGMGAATP